MCKTKFQLFLLLVVCLISGCSGKNKNIDNSLTAGAFGAGLMSNTPVSVGLSVASNVYSSKDSNEFMLDTSFESGAVALFSTGYAGYGGGLLLAHDAIKKKSITKVDPFLAVQTVCFATGQFYLSFAVAGASFIYKNMNKKKDDVVLIDENAIAYNYSTCYNKMEDCKEY